MKKTILKIAICAGVLFSVTSCREDLLETYSPGVLTPDAAIQNVDDLVLLMNSAYDIANSRSESVYTSVFTDEVGIGYANGGQGLSSEYVFLMLPSSGYAEGIWTGSYLSLARVNRVLEFADKVTATTPEDIENLKVVKAEALTFRAYLHLRILGYFTTDMTDDNALAGVLADKVFTSQEARTLQRVTNGEFYTLIHSDLDEAISLYNSLSSYSMDISRANKFFAMGLKARTYSYKGDYSNAATWADNVITQSGVTLAEALQYTRVFFGDNQDANQEVIFKLKRTVQQNSQDYNLHNGWCSVRPRLDGSPFYEVSRSLFNILEDNDIRRHVIVAPSSVVDPNYQNSADFLNTDILVINKHGGTLPSAPQETAAVTQNNGFNNDIKIMRISEMYLIKAEAKAQSNPSEAASIVNQLREKRIFENFSPINYSSPQQAYAGILKERRIEFAYEGYRFLDLKRLAAKANVGIDRDPADYAQYQGGNPANLPLSSHKWALPVPETELNANTSIQQNPGY